MHSFFFFRRTGCFSQFERNLRIFLYLPCVFSLKRHKKALYTPTVAPQYTIGKTIGMLSEFQWFILCSSHSQMALPSNTPLIPIGLSDAFPCENPIVYWGAKAYKTQGAGFLKSLEKLAKC